MPNRGGNSVALPHGDNIIAAFGLSDCDSAPQYRSTREKCRTARFQGAGRRDNRVPDKPIPGCRTRREYALAAVSQNFRVPTHPPPSLSLVSISTTSISTTPISPGPMLAEPLSFPSCPTATPDSPSSTSASAPVSRKPGRGSAAFLRTALQYGKSAGPSASTSASTPAPQTRLPALSAPICAAPTGISSGLAQGTPPTKGNLSSNGSPQSSSEPTAPYARQLESTGPRASAAIMGLLSYGSRSVLALGQVFRSNFRCKSKVERAHSVAKLVLLGNKNRDKSARFSENFCIIFFRKLGEATTKKEKADCTCAVQSI